MLKKRLIGALILITLAVVFLPMVFDGKGNNQPIAIELEIPPKPEIIAGNTSLIPVNPEVSSEESEEPDDSEVKQEQDMVEKVTGWVVQVASFSLEDNALSLQEELRNLGYSTFITGVMVNNRKMFRVRVGPLIEKEDAEKLKKDIAKQVKLNGSVLRHP